MTTTTAVTRYRMLPLGGSKANYKFAFILNGAKAAQNDLLSIANVDVLKGGVMTTDADGVRDPFTITAKTIVLTSATATPASGLVVYTGKV